MKTTIWKAWTLSSTHWLPHLPEGHKCRRTHGHNFEVEVHVSGPVHREGPFQGMVLDFAAMEAIWQQHVHGRLDHNVLNEVEGLDNPTSERLAQWVWGVFVAWLPNGVRVSKVVVQEKGTSGAVLEEA